jgi:hypothetical protein
MATSDKVYRRTEAGLKAWQNENPGLSAECRRILGLVVDETHSDSIRGGLRRYSDAQIDNWLAQLETLRLLESSPVAADRDLDFTANFKISELLGKH